MEVTSDPLLDRSYRFLVEIVVVLSYRLVITPRWKVRNVYWDDRALSGWIKEVIVDVLTFCERMLFDI